jgi:hypothetical protein
LGVLLVLLLEILGQVTFNGVYFTIFIAKVRKILIFEWILLLEIFLNHKNWVWKEKSVESLTCSHCRIEKFSILKMWKIKNVFTLGPTTEATLGTKLIRTIYSSYKKFKLVVLQVKLFFAKH